MAKKVVRNQLKNQCVECNCWHRRCGTSIYGLGFIGAAIYYISTATGFWMGVLGIFKAIVWPAFLVYSMMKSFGM